MAQPGERRFLDCESTQLPNRLRRPLSQGSFGFDQRLLCRWSRRTHSCQAGEGALREPERLGMPVDRQAFYSGEKMKSAASQIIVPSTRRATVICSAAALAALGG